MTKVSIVIPCYNSALFLDRCLESVFNQTYSDLQIICVNDGSSDKTLEILKSWQVRHPELIIIDQKNSGANVARNQGTERAQGEYIQYLDSDDVLLQQKISSQIDLALKKGKPDLVIGSYQVNRDSSDGTKVIRSSIQNDPNDDVWLKLMRTDLGITSANLFKASAVKIAGGWNETLKSSQEYDLMFRILMLNESYTYHSEVLTEIHQQPSGSITSSNQSENWKRYIHLRLKMRDHILQSNRDVDKNGIQQCLFDSIRLLYQYDKDAAVHYYDSEIPSGFVPSVTHTTGKAYVYIFKLLGFGKTEELRSLLSRWKTRKS